MDDTLILTIVLIAWAFVAILVMLYFQWEWSKERKERELKHLIAESLQDWPVEKALNDWLKTATSKGLPKYTLEDWLKIALTDWQVRDVLKKQIDEIVEAEVRRQLLDARLKAA